MQGSDMLATPDTMTLSVTWMGTHRPGPFPGNLLANTQIARTTEWTNLLLFLRRHVGICECLFRALRRPRCEPELQIARPGKYEGACRFCAVLKNSGYPQDNSLFLNHRTINSTAILYNMAVLGMS